MKKKVLLILGIFLVFVTTTISLAYFTSKENKENKFSIGSIQTKINEDFDKNSEEVKNLSTIAVKKKVCIENTGKNPVLVRVIITPQWEKTDENGNIIGNIVSASNQVQLNFSNDISKNWIKGNNGYYYYNKVLEPKETTSYLLESVQLKDNIPSDEKDEYKDRELAINVSSEATQVNEKALNNKWNLKETNKSLNDKLESIIEEYNKK
ncbi:BsaA family SipW-dependent biofilm matrix protein [Clostridium sp. Ade.TY]|uniref:BsaA family SipW-dependent biofilm matrix protein n=1 Tax=Clostridium sp. Ade.TY TaxID=1391647 RepID=UPI00040A6022|nr:BsaA family SipW-dependent biofilm matrix protein [Clostridium sp. Ade.TY]